MYIIINISVFFLVCFLPFILIRGTALTITILETKITGNNRLYRFQPIPVEYFSIPSNYTVLGNCTYLMAEMLDVQTTESCWLLSKYVLTVDAVASVVTVEAGAFLSFVMLPVSTKLECHSLIVFFVEDFFLNFVENFLCATV